jgi:hypothetical protein
MRPRSHESVSPALSPGKRQIPLTLLFLVLLGACNFYVNDSEAYRDSISIDSYQLVNRIYGQSAIAFYVGPFRENDEILRSVSAPELTLRRDPGRAEADPLYIAHGYGHTERTGECFVNISRLAGNESTIRRVGERSLSVEQRSGILDGTHSALRVGVVCEAHMDR